MRLVLGAFCGITRLMPLPCPVVLIGTILPPVLNKLFSVAERRYSRLIHLFSDTETALMEWTEMSSRTTIEQ
ncbi:hypothetical protein M0638_18825 [Roseomonas sp. NAR14]|uniref:Uncharacterized protein n=1 Tax=Roseomonas acroporae TaxID=2937791 RepID=A0A9X2BV95_9PROT|nr:hypothetical protein [Roseomonas acroporae]MCK8786433.1 hypothetical protein [Roseomonas acroporae]